jgi:hypothetical protein
MQYLKANPDGPAESYEWTNRFQVALDNFSVCTKAQRIRRSIGFGLLVFIVSAPLTWLALFLPVWIWYFALYQLQELSRVMRGQSPRPPFRDDN